MGLLGHSTIRLTMDPYGHVMPERLRAAADAMDEALGVILAGLPKFVGIFGHGRERFRW
jgi:hypothetical protein